MTDDVVFICITPVKNEAWILPYFLEVNSYWADKFIVVDQLSTDRSREILNNHPKVMLVENKKTEYDELYRSKLLWDLVRKVDAKKRIVMALDADELIPPQVIDSNEWNSLKKLDPGSRIYMKWIHVLPDCDKYYDIGELKPFGYVDDGNEINGKKIHNDRVPSNNNVNPFLCNEIVNVHLGYVPIIRNYKKHSWYMIWEFLNSENSAFDLNKNYRKFIGWNGNSIKVIDKKWIPKGEWPEKLDIESEDLTWWDIDIINWINEFGESKFKKLDIWDFNWNLIGQKVNSKRNIKDPRSLVDRLILYYIKKTKYKKNNLIKIVNSIIKTYWK